MQCSSLHEEKEEEADDEVKNDMDDGERRPVKVVNKNETIVQHRKERIQDGDYVYAPGGLMEGVYFRGGIIIDFKQEDKIESEFNEEWRDDSIANSSVIKLRKIAGTTYFGKGILFQK